MSFALLWHLIRVIGLMPIKRRGNFQMVKVVIRETLALLPWMFQSIYFSNKKNFFVSPILQMEVQSPKTWSKEGFCSWVSMTSEKRLSLAEFKNESTWPSWSTCSGGQALLFSFEYDLLPNLISNFNHYLDSKACDDQKIVCLNVFTATTMEFTAMFTFQLDNTKR